MGSDQYEDKYKTEPGTLWLIQRPVIGEMICRGEGIGEVSLYVYGM